MSGEWLGRLRRALGTCRFKRWRKRVAEALRMGGAGPAAGASAGGGEGRGGAVADGGAEDGGALCAICYEAPPDAVFTACGHLCCCTRCAEQVDRCPICRVRGNAIRVFS